VTLPHDAGTVGQFGTLRAVQRNILGENAAKLYGL